MFISSCSLSIHLVAVSFGLCNAGGGCFPSCFPAVSGPLLSPGSPGQRLGPQAFPWDRDWLGGRLSSSAVPSPKDSTEEGVPGSGLLHRAVLHIAMVAGLNPSVIIFYCTQSDIAACYHRFWVLPSLCGAGFAPLD